MIKIVQKFFWGMVTLAMFGMMACAPKQASISPWPGEETAASFTATVQQRPDLPLQGGMEITAQGGRMALVTQHGRTLGQCTWSAKALPAASTRQMQNLMLYCQGAEGLGVQVQGLVQDVALAVYAGMQQRQKKNQQGALQESPFMYTGDSGNIEIFFIGGQ